MAFKKIMVCVDLSQGITDKVVNVAGDIANRMASPIYLVHVVEREIPILVSEGIVMPKVELEKFEEMYRTLEEKATAKLEALAQKIQAEWKLEVRPKVFLGEPFSLILNEAEKESVDLIVVGSHGKQGIERLLLGSVSEKVARKAKCSVLVVR
jgi:nucleotide-binding universal stress UspA family protein